MLLRKLGCETRLCEVFQQTGLIDELFYGHLFYKSGVSSPSLENKSKTKEARTAAYQLLQKVVEVLEPHRLAEFLEDRVWDLIKEMPRPKKWKYLPSDNSRSVVN